MGRLCGSSTHQLVETELSSASRTGWLVALNVSFWIHTFIGGGIHFFCPEIVSKAAFACQRSRPPSTPSRLAAWRTLSSFGAQDQLRQPYPSVNAHAPDVPEDATKTFFRHELADGCASFSVLHSDAELSQPHLTRARQHRLPWAWGKTSALPTLRTAAETAACGTNTATHMPTPNPQDQTTCKLGTSMQTHCASVCA